jgi:acetyl-CoA C-acetyltransferase
VTETVPGASDYGGPGTIAASTVTYEGFEPKELIAVIDTPDGRRAIARSDDDGLLTSGTQATLVGQEVDVAGSRIA